VGIQLVMVSSRLVELKLRSGSMILPYSLFRSNTSRHEPLLSYRRRTPEAKGEVMVVTVTNVNSGEMHGPFSRVRVTVRVRVRVRVIEAREFLILQSTWRMH
jgi:hypothetical protein